MKRPETDRLILCTWVDEDLESTLDVNQDLKVIRYFPGMNALKKMKNFIDTINSCCDNHGSSLYVILRKDVNECLGFIGLRIADCERHFAPATEMGWRLLSSFF